MKSLLLSLAFVSCLGACSVKAQNKPFSIFGSYVLGFGNIISKAETGLTEPQSQQIEKLRSGTISQFEIGSYYKSLGLAFIYNSYDASAETNYENADVNTDARFEDGILNDDLTLRFYGGEIRYKINIFNRKMNLIYKYALGVQKYTIEKDVQIIDNRPYTYSNKLKGSTFTSLLGAEVNYNILKSLSVGIETSIVPGKYKKLNSEYNSYSTNESTARLNTGIKVTVTL